MSIQCHRLRTDSLSTLAILVCVVLASGCDAFSQDINEPESATEIARRGQDVIPSSEAGLRSLLANSLKSAAEKAGRSADTESMVMASTPDGLIAVAKTVGQRDPGFFTYLLGPDSTDPDVVKGLVMQVVYVVHPNGFRYASLRDPSGAERYRVPLFESERSPTSEPLSLTTGARPPYPNDGGQKGDDLYVCVKDNENGGYMYLNLKDNTCEPSPTGELECSQ